jgi:hypothetical protein
MLSGRRGGRGAVRKGIVLAVDWASVGSPCGEAANGQEGLDVIAPTAPTYRYRLKMPRRMDGDVRQLMVQATGPMLSSNPPTATSPMPRRR